MPPHWPGGGKAWPARRVLVANLISTALVGIVVSQVVRFLPWKADMVVTLLAAGLTGHVLGPRGVAWAFAGMVNHEVRPYTHLAYRAKATGRLLHSGAGTK